MEDTRQEVAMTTTQINNICSLQDFITLFDSLAPKIVLAENLERQEFFTTRDFQNMFWTLEKVVACLPLPARPFVTVHNFLTVKDLVQVVAFNEDGELMYADELEVMSDNERVGLGLN